MKTKSTNPYNPFFSYLFRSPYFPINQLTGWLEKLDNFPDYIREILERPDIQEALYLASPVLYEEIFKYLGDRLKPKDKEKFFFSVLKYLSRMATRCTPFGLFAGCSVGQVAESAHIELPVSEQYSRHTRLDMNYLCALAQDIAKSGKLRYRLRYYPNNSSYVVGDQLRYVECRYHNGSRKHNIVAIDHTEYIEHLRSKAKGGATVEDLSALLIDDEISQEEAIEFIDELINNQVLISELEPSVTGPELLDQLIQSLERLDDQQELTNRLKTLSGLLQAIDTKPIGKTISLYGQIKEQLTALGTPYNEKHLFQSDMIKRCEKAEIDQKIVSEVVEAITFLNKISPQSRQETIIDKFASSFYERYEDREIPLAQLLDTEMGLSFRQGGSGGDLSPLLDGIPFGAQQQGQGQTSHFWSGIQSLVHRKVMEALTGKQQEVVLTDDDVKKVSIRWDDLPHTISVMCEIFSYNSNGASKMYLHGIGGSGAANMLGRFCHVDEGVHKLVTEIIREEEQALPEGKLYAEVVHLPESRIGNIIARPVLRPFEICYLAKSGVEKEFQLEISDLMVSVKNKKFILRSKRLNKEIIPRLSTAHNYSQPNAMPIYQFLCNLQNQRHRGGIGLFLSGLFDEFPFLPRISYKNVILSLAKWRIKPEAIKQIAENKDIEALKHWKEQIKIPRFVVLPDGDNELFVDTDSFTSLSVLYSVVKKRPQFTLQEFPFDMDNAILNNETGAFTNEFLFTFHKNKPA
ncbi:MAG: lantibiotic dehydratase family protein [Bacteroidales bacterium]|nr:lantibiotic dehydratase family protein [Bacteroidales bacterium]